MQTTTFQPTAEALTLQWPAHVSGAWRAQIELKASLVETRYSISAYRFDNGDMTGKFALIPSTARGVEINPKGYEVDLATRRCTCPGFNEASICSHLVATVERVARDRWIEETEQHLQDLADDRAASMEKFLRGQRVRTGAELRAAQGIPLCESCGIRSADAASGGTGTICGKCF